MAYPPVAIDLACAFALARAIDYRTRGRADLFLTFYTRGRLKRSARGVDTRQ